MDGILVVDKDKNYTSRDIVNMVSKTFGIKKVGHTGTLDPLATGVLVICVGQATKLVELLTCDEKEYIAEITLGIDTDTLDITGNILKEKETKIDTLMIDKVLKEMIGIYEQEVPKYSAIKINGKKLYEYARNNEDIVLPKRNVHIKTLERISDVKYVDGKVIFSIKTTVSKGTYIRSLVRDIALKLDTIGVMSSLRRTKQGIFNLEEANKIDDIKNHNVHLLKIDEALNYLDQEIVDDVKSFKIKNGVPLTNEKNLEMVLFKDKNNNCLALYKKNQDLLKAYKVFRG